jgi:glycosyltransferase 2 family protein
LLLAEKNISPLDVFWANMSGYLGNNLLPARIGELVRSAYANRTANISMSFALASGLSERLMDLVALILLGAASLAFSGIAPDTLQGAIRLMSVAAGIGVIAIIVLPRFGGLLEKIIGKIQFIQPPMKEKLISFLEKFLLGLQSLLNLQRAVTFILLTALIWLMDGLNAVLIGYLLHIPITLSQAFVLLAGLGLSSAIPSTPGYVGVHQFVAVVVLGPFGIESSAALALILFVQACNWLVVGFWGLIALWKFFRKNEAAQ